MKTGIIAALILTLFYFSSTAHGASAKCTVVEKKGNVLIMDCGERAKDFEKKNKVKIKTDRGKK